MFLFISANTAKALTVLTNSNTSHVFIYRKGGMEHLREKLIQIHPMFLFIRWLGRSCRFRIRFKYIPCFYLSENDICIIENRSLFKYIPCFYLSLIDEMVYIEDRYSNTSHVFIYLGLARSLRFGFGNSNTSHVFIYLALRITTRSFCSYSNTSHVFIYPMNLWKQEKW